MSLSNYLGDISLNPATNPNYDDVLDGTVNGVNPLPTWKKIYARLVSVGALQFYLNNFCINPQISTFNPLSNNLLTGSSDISNYYSQNFTTTAFGANAQVNVFGAAQTGAPWNANVTLNFTRLNNLVFMTLRNCSFTTATSMAGVCSVWFTAFPIPLTFLPYTTSTQLPMNHGSTSGLWYVNNAPTINFPYYMNINVSAIGTITFTASVQFGLSGTTSTGAWFYNQPAGAIQTTNIAQSAIGAGGGMTFETNTLTYPCRYYRNLPPAINS